VSGSGTGSGTSDLTTSCVGPKVYRLWQQLELCLTASDHTCTAVGMPTSLYMVYHLYPCAETCTGIGVGFTPGVTDWQAVWRPVVCSYPRNHRSEVPSQVPDLGVLVYGTVCQYVHRLTVYLW